jgi:hypothetical protein
MFENWNKPVVGLTFGAALGFVDGLTALLYPDTGPMMGMILMGSTFKGLLAGVVAGLLARKWQSVPLGIVAGLIVAAVITYPFAAAPAPNGKVYFWEIMVPGALVGALVGFATQRFGKLPAATTVASRSSA